MEIFELFKDKLGDKVKTNEPLARYTTLKIGGPAEYFYVASTTSEVLKAVSTAKTAKIRFLILGGGSNVVISDRGIKGLVVRNESRNIAVVKRIGKVAKGKMNVSQALVEVDAGVLINHLLRFTFH